MAKYMDEFIYVGKGEHLIGLPATDMTDEEFTSYPKELQQAALKLGLYKIDKPKSTKEVKDA